MDATRARGYGPLLLVLLLMQTEGPGPGAQAVILTPPYFNLATGRRITATATCGVDTEQPELYCKLVGANAENDVNVNLIQGQVCDYCDPNRPNQRHPPEFAVDGMETWWQSPPLSRGMKYNEVNLTIDLGQEFHVAYVYVRMGNSPRPGLWVLEKSTDYGKTFTPWQYFSDSPADCVAHFGAESLQAITRDDSVVCSTEYSKIVPLEGGEIPISLLNNRPSANTYFNSSVLQEWTRATNVRLRLLRTKNLLGHLMSVARQDPTVTRRYFYSIKDISIGGRCMCNGHADSCDAREIGDTKLVCHCQHHTCGDQCSECCPGFRQKRWRISKAYQIFECEPCNCHNHTAECDYDEEVDAQRLSLDVRGNYEGGGVCRNCNHNTEGINCNRCRAGYYRPHGRRWDQEDVCEACRCDYHYSTGNCTEGSGQCECRPEFRPPNCDACSYGHFGYPDCRPCECNLNGTVGYHCEASGGSCPCRANFAGARCNLCADGHFGLPECQRCECDAPGALSSVCDKQSGECACRRNFRGRTCHECEHGYFGHPNCTLCACDVRGSEQTVCNKNTGECLCRPGYGGSRCDQCLPGYYGYPDCRPCNCSNVGSASTVCDIGGKCPCLGNFAGRTCSLCSPGFYGYPECLACSCNPHGSIGVSCDDGGLCKCRPAFEGQHCDRCRAGFYNFPRCEECNCHPAGVAAGFAGCDSVPAGELCRCKERVRGRQCDRCRPLYWNLRLSDADGCERCGCEPAGVLAGIGVCDPRDGQCACKPAAAGRACDRCAPGTYLLREQDVFGCRACACDIGGAVDTACDQASGQCACQPRVTGRACDRPIQAHYFPTLYQMQYELEDGRTPENTPVRHDYDEAVFPGYSWRGYAVFKPQLQPEVIVDVYVLKPSVYRMVLSYVNPGAEPVIGQVTITPDSPSDIEQQFRVVFPPSRDPMRVTASVDAPAAAPGQDESPAPFVMNPGRWAVRVRAARPLLVDYLVLLPSAYYEATILSESVEAACVAGEKNLCRHYAYPDVAHFDVVHGEGAFLADGDSRRSLTEFMAGEARLNELFPAGPTPQMPLLNSAQPELHLDMTVTRPGYYVLLLMYVTEENGSDNRDGQLHHVAVHTSGQQGRDQGRAALRACPYSAVCRQPVLDAMHRVKHFHFDSNFVRLTLKAPQDEPGSAAGVALRSVVAVPAARWSLDYVRPAPVCVRKDGRCVRAKFPDAPESRRVKFEAAAASAGSNVTATANETATDGDANGSEGYHHRPVDVVLGAGAGAEPVVDVRAKVPQPGQYVFVVQHRQPSHPAFTVPIVIQNGQFYEAQLRVAHCPAAAGCRSVVMQADGNVRFTLTENFWLTLRLDRRGARRPAKHHGHDSEDYEIEVSDLYSEDPDELEELDDELGLEGGSGEFEGGYGDGGLDAGAPHVTLDYLLVVPADQYSDALLREERFDRSGEFIARCGHDHFEPGAAHGDEFCRAAVFSLTADYNNGALPCQCDFDGSLSFECEPYGGQCQCRPNVVGRQCEACRTGFYGFPECRPCNCPSIAVCEDNTGQCICPPRVIGENCDQCEEYTFGFDPIIGCAECGCHPLGVLNNQQCDLLDGRCECKPHVEGRRCDRCAPGHHAFPYCDACACDARGTTDDVCDADSARCLCKPNVVGPACDTCREGTFDLQPQNAEGCARCFCFGRTTRCASSALHRAALQDMRNWTLVALEGAAGFDDLRSNVTVRPLTAEQAPHRQLNESVLGADLTGEAARASVAYFGAPAAYLGNKLTAYGGRLGYTVFYTIGERGSAVSGADVVLVGAGLHLLHHAAEQPAAELDYRASLRLTEDQFVVVPGGLPASREQLMQALHALSALYVRATYWDTAVTTRLADVSLDVAAEDGTGEPASAVERCHCPPGYRGLSCEECAPGYWRSTAGLFGGSCVPCQCHGHADECDVRTGVCLGCRHSTRGDHCEQCEVGYHGNAQQGTPGDCLICACPLPTAANNFATACEVSADGERIHCDCRPGYFGARCQSCSAGFFGRPELPGDYCRPCNCSGNIDVNDQASCDTVSGECLRCLNNTAGPACGLCKPGFYGDAVLLKDCQPCVCDELGTRRCNAGTGQCECLPGVEGDKCDRCRDHHYGFTSGRGCQPCACGAASHSAQCDDATGQCRCRPGATGRVCDRCAVGFYNYTQDGCVSCGCHTPYSLGFGCNVLTGQCECLPGVEGDKCDRCPHRWVLKPQQGCFECDPCVHALLDVTDQLRDQFAPVQTEFEAATSGHFTRRRLKYLRGVHDELRPRVDQLDPAVADVLRPAERRLDALEQETRTTARKANYTVESGRALPDAADELRRRALAVLADVHSTAAYVLVTVGDVDSLTFEEAGEGRRLEDALREAGEAERRLAAMDLSPREQQAAEQLERAQLLLDDMLVLAEPVDTAIADTRALRERMAEFRGRLDDLANYTRRAAERVAQADELRGADGAGRVAGKAAAAAAQWTDAQDELRAAHVLLTNATELLTKAHRAARPVSDPAAADELERLMDEFEATTVSETALVDELELRMQEAAAHAANLSETAQELDHLFSDTRDISETAVQAANSYRNIVNATEAARAAADEALSAANDTEQLTEGLGEACALSAERATRLLEDANKVLYQARAELKPKLLQAADRVDAVRESANRSRDILDQVETALGRLGARDFEEAAERAAAVARAADDRALSALKLLDATRDGQGLGAELERARQLPRQLEDTARDVKQAHAQLATVAAVLPNVTRLIDETGPQQAALRADAADLDERMRALRQRVAAARELANRVRVGVTFNPKTTLELRKPAHLADQSTVTSVSVYANTSAPNGLLWFLGNERGAQLRRTQSDDYMALQLENGYPVLNMDVGNGRERVVSPRHVSDGQWRQLRVERVGPRVRLVVREQLADGREHETVEEADLAGAYTVFNLDERRSRLFVGGYPPSFEPPADLPSSFDGQLEELTVGGAPVSLWNFVDAEENSAGARHRNQLINLQPSTGCRLDGRGYAVLNARPHSLRQRTELRLRFKTSAPDGLLFLAGRAPTHMALELRDGRVRFSYDLGDGPAAVETADRYDDGRWHNVEAGRDGRVGLLKVDERLVGQAEARGPSLVVHVTDLMYFGGHPGEHGHAAVTRAGFDGCIEAVEIMSTPVDLALALHARGSTPGCPDRYASLVSFGAADEAAAGSDVAAAHGYVRHPNASAAGAFRLSVRFRSRAPDGLLAYVTDREQTDAAVALGLRAGAVVLISRRLELRTRTTTNYSDGEWHVASVTHDESELRLDVDDWDLETVADSPPPPPRIMYGDLYLGGLPPDFVAPRGAVPTTRPFSGCLADATFNGRLVNFANATDRSGGVLGRCALDPRPEPLPDDLYEPPVVASGPDHTEPTATSELPPPDITGKPIRGDGGVDEGDDEDTTPESSTLVPGIEVPAATTTDRRWHAGTTTTTAPDERATIVAESEGAATVRTTTLPPLPMTTAAEAITTAMTPEPQTTPKTEMATTPAAAVGTSAGPPASTTEEDAGAVRTTEKEAPQQCALPLEPAELPAEEAGVRLGGAADSRLEFHGTRGTYRRKYDFALDLKTTARDGLVFYASDEVHAHFIALQVRDGQLRYMFSCGGAPAVLETDGAPVNDGRWHSVKFSRVNLDGKLVVDEQLRAEGRAEGSLKGLNLTLPVYVGGVPAAAASDVAANVHGPVSLQGCVRRVHMNGRPLESAREFGSFPCSESVERGVFFGARGGFMRLMERYRVGTEMDIQMDIKPRNVSGILMSVHGKRDFLVLQMVDGEVRFVVDNGKGPIKATFKPPVPHYFCDGNWHTIQAIKSKNVVSLSVDKTFAEAGVGHQTTADTRGALFLGGHMHISRPATIRGFATRSPFVGCIRNVHINTRPFKLEARAASGHVIVGACPTT